MSVRVARTIDEEYFDWLRRKVTPLALEKNPRLTHTLLLEILFREPFKYFVPNDHNRAEDGVRLRDQFLDETEAQGAPRSIGNWIDLECSILEMLIALTHRLQFETGVDSYEWFWILIKNLDLEQYTDEVFDDTIAARVRMTVNKLEGRTYDADGYGGLFPLRRPQRDQRQVELWYQASAYIIENYWHEP